ncbi:MAG: hypothetical protein KGZ96_12630 [Clostridia bacterium]|jgi:hypothetical protein|nr:hypothetical protein [Clostridia bacterium]
MADIIVKEGEIRIWDSEDNLWHLVEVPRERNGQESYLYFTDGWHCEYPEVDSNGEVIYKEPDKIPQCYRDEVEIPIKEYLAKK